MRKYISKALSNTALLALIACNSSSFTQSAHNNGEGNSSPEQGASVDTEKYNNALPDSSADPANQGGEADPATANADSTQPEALPIQSTEPVDIAGAFLAGGFVKREGGNAYIGFDAFSDKEFKTRHVGTADDALRPFLKDRMSIGYFDPNSSNFTKFAADKFELLPNGAAPPPFTFAFRVPEDKAHLLTLFYDDRAGTERYVPVNFPTVFPVNFADFPLLNGKGGGVTLITIQEHAISINDYNEVVLKVYRKDNLDMDKQRLTVITVSDDYFQVKNNNINKTLGVIAGSQDSLKLPNETFCDGDVNAKIPAEAPILKFGVVGDTLDDNNIFSLKLGYMQTKSGYIICALNLACNYNLLIGIPASALDGPHRQAYLDMCPVLALADGDREFWRTSFEWWSPSK